MERQNVCTATKKSDAKKNDGDYKENLKKTLRDIVEKPDQTGEKKTGELKGYRTDHIEEDCVIWTNSYANAGDGKQVETVWIVSIKHHDKMTQFQPRRQDPVSLTKSVEVRVPICDDIGRAHSRLRELNWLDQDEEWTNEALKMSGTFKSDATANKIRNTVPGGAEVSTETFLPLKDS